MIEETGNEEGSADLSGQEEAASTTSKGMAEALDAVRASSPSLGAAVDAANLTPGELADAHDRATSEQSDPDRPQS
jgi:ABC-type transporter Mla subunit MlaD